MSLNFTFPLAVCTALVVIPWLGASAQTMPKANPKMKVADGIPEKASAFSLKDVRILGGPFKHAMDLDHQYLLSLDPDRLLHNFRVNAGLPSSAKPLGGWEAPDSEVRGHFVGHYLSACAQMYAATGDEKLKANATYVITELAKCQKALGNGYLSAFPETFIDRVETLKPVWAPWYTVHKILAGLIDNYSLCDNKQALDMAIRMGDWAKHRMDKLSDDQMQRMLENEQGGINEGLANLYAITGKKEYLALSERFNHHAVIDPLARREDALDGLHANTQIPKIIGAARQYELTGDPKLQTTASFFWDVVTRDRSYVIGGNSDGEHFSPKAHLSAYLSPTTTETCNTYNMLKLTHHLFTWDPKAHYADYYERALFNHILASQDPDDGMMCYYVPLHSGSRKQYSTPNDSFWCCTGTGVENHARYGDSIYYHEGGQGLYVNLFIDSKLDWKSRGITVRQETRFPEEGLSHLAFTCARPTRMAVHIRRPAWATSEFHVLVNGKEDMAAVSPSSYAVISRTWKTGDRVEIRMPMGLHTEAFKDNANRLAFLYGPIVLSAEWNGGAQLPVIVSAGHDVQDGVTPVQNKTLTFTGEPGVFKAVGEPSGEKLTFKPFYATYKTSYVVYWDVFTPEQWEVKQAQVKAQLAQERALEARSVDVIHPGEEQNERDHKFTGAMTNNGDFGGKKWRDARAGGWFSYELKTLPDAALDLGVTYWGSDGGGRDFDILVDDVKIATESLANKHPDKFFDVVYPIPTDLTKGKSKVTVRYQAHPGSMAGGVFACRILKQSGVQK